MALGRQLIVLHAIEMAHGFDGQLVRAISAPDSYFIDLKFPKREQARAFSAIVRAFAVS